MDEDSGPAYKKIRVNEDEGDQPVVAAEMKDSGGGGEPADDSSKDMEPVETEMEGDGADAAEGAVNNEGEKEPVVAAEMKVSEGEVELIDDSSKDMEPVEAEMEGDGADAAEGAVTSQL